MRSFLMAAFVLTFACAMAFAQTQTEPKGTHETTVTGCLGGGPGHYTILTREGKTIQVQTTNKDVDKLVGHTVAASGTETPGARSSEDTTLSNPNGKNAGAEAIFSAGTLVDISPACSQKTTQANPKY